MSGSNFSARVPTKYNIVVIGHPGSGKSSLVFRSVMSEFFKTIDPTMEESLTRNFTVDNEPVTLEILDTGQQEDYLVLHTARYPNVDGFLLLYSIRYLDTFNYLPEFYKVVLRSTPLDNKTEAQDVPEPLPTILVGCCSDLEEKRVTSQSQGSDMAKQLGCPFLECSAKDNTNVDEVFAALIRHIRSYKARYEPPRPIPVEVEVEHRVAGCCVVS